MVNETQLLEQVQALAADLGLLTHHPLTHCGRCGTALSPRLAGNAGFPDLVIAGPAGVLFRELKSPFGLLRPKQTAWRYQLAAAGMDWETFRPVDWFSGRIGDQLRAIAGHQA
jgi:hypothetical protein